MSLSKYSLGAHDYGGSEKYLQQSLNRDDKTLSYFDRKIDSLMFCLGMKGVYTFPEIRCAIEELPPNAYANIAYYEKWMYAILVLCLKGHFFTEQELREKYAQFMAAQAQEQSQSQTKPHSTDINDNKEPRFETGDKVKVRDVFDNDLSAEFWRYALRLPKHIRVPAYIQGQIGVIESYVGAEENAELIALGITDSPPSHMYRVRFQASDVFEPPGGGAEQSCGDNSCSKGNPKDTIDVELLQHWLQTHIEVDEEEEEEDDVHTGDEAYSHPHSHSHSHERRVVVEANAKAIEAVSSPYQVLSEIVIDLLCEKGVITRRELTAFVEITDKAIANQERVGTLGSKIVVKALRNPQWKSELLAHPNPLEFVQSSFRECELALYEPTKVVFLENTPEVHNVLVCTLCSCYPRQLLGIPPPWYKSAKYRAEVVRNPRLLLRKEFGCHIPDNVAIRVHDSCQELRYMVIPHVSQIPGYQQMTDEELQRKITRDVLVGVKRMVHDSEDRAVAVQEIQSKL